VHAHPLPRLARTRCALHLARYRYLTPDLTVVTGTARLDHLAHHIAAHAIPSTVVVVPATEPAPLPTQAETHLLALAPRLTVAHDVATLLDPPAPSAAA
jgi:hypothetical protein